MPIEILIALIKIHLDELLSGRFKFLADLGQSFNSIKMLKEPDFLIRNSNLTPNSNL
jgi:hypothetical protein